MTNRSLIVTEEAYDRLIHLKKEDETISQLIIRLTSKGGDSETSLDTFNFLKSQKREDLEDLADSIEEVYKNRRSLKFRIANL